jgi:RimJ/RimL family protein N-acetyltransferase
LIHGVNLGGETVLLRQWRDEDLDPFAAMNADPVVMEFYPRCQTREESAEAFRRLRSGIAERGWGLWAVEVDGAFAGYTGLAVPRFEAPFMPCVELGWRLRREYWGRGIAMRAARQAEAHAFQELRLPGLVSFTAAINSRSRRLMERLGFSRAAGEDFLHPSLDVDSPLRLHVLYRKTNPGSQHTASSV